MKYPVGTIIKSKRAYNLVGRIIEVDGENNLVLWSDGEKPDWTNTWCDENFDDDYDKTMYYKHLLPEELFHV